MFCKNQFKKIFYFTLINSILAHGRLAWRYYEGYPINYDDNGLSEHDSVCGSTIYERGNGYLKNPLRKYISGQIIDIHCVITANHLGSIEISVCKLEDPDGDVTQDCLNENKLEVVTYYRRDKVNKFKAILFENDQDVLYKVKLPDDFVCNRCVLQWHWYSLNTGEEFKNCADIMIVSNNEINLTNSHLLSTQFTFNTTNSKYNQQLSTKKIHITNNMSFSSKNNSLGFLNMVDKNIRNTTNIPFPLYACSNHQAPPINNINVSRKFNGLMVICFKSVYAKIINCELCKLCISPHQKCPLKECECRWY